MKRFVASLLAAATCNVVMGQGMQLDQGQSYTFEFTSIPFVPPPSSDPIRSRVIAWFDPGTFQNNEEALFEIFANNLSDTPRTTSITFVEYPDRFGMIYSWSVLGPNAQPPFFPDLQGVLRVTMVSGSAQLSGFEVAQYINGDYYLGYFPIPEPGIPGLFVPALLSLIYFRRVKKN